MIFLVGQATQKLQRRLIEARHDRETAEKGVGGGIHDTGGDAASMRPGVRKANPMRAAQAAGTTWKNTAAQWHTLPASTNRCQMAW